MKLFLDTNILIDFLLERQPFYPASAMIVSYAVERKTELYLSSLSIVTANYICVERCKMSQELYRKKMDFLRKHINVCSVTSKNVYNAYDAECNDFEDGVQCDVAKECHANYIVTRNMKDFEGSIVLVITAEQACGLLETI